MPARHPGLQDDAPDTTRAPNATIRLITSDSSYFLSTPDRVSISARTPAPLLDRLPAWLPSIQDQMQDRPCSLMLCLRFSSIKGLPGVPPVGPAHRSVQLFRTNTVFRYVADPLHPKASGALGAGTNSSALDFPKRQATTCRTPFHYQPRRLNAFASISRSDDREGRRVLQFAVGTRVLRRLQDTRRAIQAVRHRCRVVFVHR